MALLAGTKGTYTNSMADAIEKAFLAEWPKVMIDQPVPDSNDQMRLLFMAIAQGVVQHLVDHPEAFTITVRNLQNEPLPVTVSIAQDNSYTNLS